MPDNAINVSAESLGAFVTGIFRHAGCSKADATHMAQCLVQTNLWGIDSHGVLRVPEYVGRFQSGAMNTTPDIRTLKEGSGLEVLDADNGPGYIAARAAMSRAIELAEKGNIAAVGIINSNHCGATSLYARMALERDMIGLAMSNVAPNMVMPGGIGPITGNNPVAVAVPSFGEFPFVLDISMSTVAGGKLLVAAQNGEEIPLDWATDADGRPTNDPTAGFEGFLLPMGGHKGFGIALLVDILCGVITGGSFQHHLKSMYRSPDDPSKTAHLMVVVNPLVFMDKEQLKLRMDEFFETVKESPMWDKDREMLLPGEIEYRKEQERRRCGIPLPATVYDELVQIGNEMNLDAELSVVPP
jgi:L-2-hydroxycarboxylate dehydrogenase (NAD+)